MVKKCNSIFSSSSSKFAFRILFPNLQKYLKIRQKLSHLSSTTYSFGAKIQIRLNKTVAKLLWKIDNFFGQLQICLVIGKIEWDICQAFAKNTRFVMILYYTSSLSFQASRRHFENDLVFLSTSWNNKVSWFSETKLSDWHHYVQKAWLRGAQEGKCHVTLKRKIVLQSVTPNDKVNTVFENYLIKVILYVAFDDFGVKIQRL